MGEGPQDGLSSPEARQRLRTLGANTIPEEPPHLARELALRFWGPVPWMLEAALLLEIVLSKLPEAAILSALLVFNAILAEVQEHRAKAALELLRSRLQVTARVRRDGAWTSVPSSEVVPGDLVHLKVGEVVPADGRVLEGELEVDQSTLTGESEPVLRAVGSTVYSSSTVRRGSATAEITATGSRSFYGRTAELVRTARTVSHLETLLFGIVRYLVTLDSLMAVIVLTFAGARGDSLAEVVPFVLILLIASVPAAMPATFTIANAIESRRLVEQGVLVTGLTAVQEAASMDVLCIDKTGTLTEGRERVSELAPFGEIAPGGLVARAASACDDSTGDTVDLAILEEARRQRVEMPRRTQFVPFDPATKRSEAVVLEAGQELRVILGSPNAVAELCGGSTPALRAGVERLSRTGARVLAVAVGEPRAPSVIGLIALADRVRPEAPALVRALHSMGVRVVMLTGDTEATARAVGREVGVGERIGVREDLERDPAPFDGFAGVYPQDKHRLVRAFQQGHHIVGMSGDGVNDAPALKQAEVGIAVAGSTDVARASAKLVLTRPGLSDIVHAVEGGRRVYRRMLTWTLNKVSKNFEQVFLLTGGFVAAGVFVTTPFLILLLIFANDFVTMSVGSDRARISPTPDRWDLREILCTSALVGGSWLAVSLALLGWALDIAHLPLGALQTLFFLYLVFGSQGTVLLVRERDRAWASGPSTFLLLVIAADIAVVSLLALTGTLVPARLEPSMVLSLLAVVAVAAVGVDQLKVAFIRWTGAFGPGSRLARRPS